MEDLLLENLDDIPSLMHLVQNAPASPGRFRGIVNNSFNMDQTLQASNSNFHKSYSHQTKRMVLKASKVLSELSKMDDVKKKKPQRNINEIAEIAKKALSQKSSSGNPVNLFRNFDENKNGYVSYDDFHQTLLATNAGLTKKETLLLVNALDKDKNGILDYTELTSTLSTLAKQSSNNNNKNNDKSFDNHHNENSTPSIQLSSFNSIPDSSKQEIFSSSEPTDPIIDGYQRAYEYGLKYAKKYQEEKELYEINEKKYYESLGPNIDIPYTEREFHFTSLKPSRTPLTETSKVSYPLGKGKMPVTMEDKVKDIIFPTNQKILSKKNQQSKSKLIHDDDGSESNSSYSDIFLNSRKSRPENQDTGITESYNGRHITGAGPLSTTIVGLPKGADPGGPVQPYERAYKGNPTNVTNRSSRDFTNAFIVDQAKPIRRKRTSSAPPASRNIETNDASLGNYLYKSVTITNSNSNDNDNFNNSLNKSNSLFQFQSQSQLSNNPPLLPFEQLSQQQSLPYDQTVSNGVTTSFKSIIPTHESYIDTNKNKKKRIHPVSKPPIPSQSKTLDVNGSTLQMSLNTLMSQMNSYSKMKIFEHKMKQFDISQSGFINKSEFVSSLNRTGIHLSPEQIQSIFESHAKEPSTKTSNSIKLSDRDDRGIPIAEFINKLQTRISTPALQSKFLKDDTLIKFNEFKKETPLEKSDKMNWKKVIETINSKNLDTKRSLEFFKNLQTHQNNKIPSNELLKELNYFGVKLNDIEFHNLTANVKKTSDGLIDVHDFCQQLDQNSKYFNTIEQTTALMPSLQHSTSTLSEHSKTMLKLEQQTRNDENNSIKRYIQQKKHFHDKIGKESMYDSEKKKTNSLNSSSNEVNKSQEYLQIFQEISKSQSMSQKTDVPSYLLTGNSSDMKKERLRWYKMKEVIVNKRNDLLKSFSGPEQLQSKYTPNQIRDKFSEVGIQLGDDDFKLFQSFVQSSTSPNSVSQTTSLSLTSSSSSSLSSPFTSFPSKQNTTLNNKSKDINNGINFEQIFDSIGVSVHVDSTRKAKAICSEDCQRDGGIFGASEKSLLSHPTYRVNMLSSSIDDTNLGRGNRRRHYNPITGELLDPNPLRNSTTSASEFWKFEHVPEIKFLPGNATNHRSNNYENSNGYKYQGTTLRQLKQSNERNKRSLSAPPSSSRTKTTTESSEFLWQNHQNQNRNQQQYPQQQQHHHHHHQQQNQTEISRERYKDITRFASTPLAQYIKIRNELVDSNPHSNNNNKMKADELNSSYDTYASTNKSYLITESHDMRNREE